MLKLCSRQQERVFSLLHPATPTLQPPQGSENKEILSELIFNYVVSESPHKSELSSNDKCQQKATRLVALFLFLEKH